MTNETSEIRVETDGCGCAGGCKNGCGCLLFVAGICIFSEVVQRISSAVDDIIQEVPGTYVTVIGAGIIVREIMKSRGKNRKKKVVQQSDNFGKEKGQIIDGCVEIIEK